MSSFFSLIGLFFSILRLFNPYLLKSRPMENSFEEIATYEVGFKSHYKKYLKDKVVKFEEERIKALKIARRNAFIAIPLMLILPFGVPYLFLIWIANIGDQYLEFLFFGILIIYALLFWFITSSMTLYQESIKKEIFPNILNFFGDFKYNHETQKSAGLYEYSGLIPHFNRETSEDHISGKYKGVSIDLFETELEQKRRTKKSSYYVTVFKGILISLSMNKKFTGKTVVRKDSGMIGNWFKKTFSSLKNVKLEDPNFEKLFEVYSDNQVEARYLLTVTFMERLKELAETFGGKSIQCCFYNKELFLMIPLKKNLFEPSSIFEPEDFIDDSKSLLKELNLIFSIIEQLKLNMKINL